MPGILANPNIQNLLIKVGIKLVVHTWSSRADQDRGISNYRIWERIEGRLQCAIEAESGQVSEWSQPTILSTGRLDAREMEYRDFLTFRLENLRRHHGVKCISFLLDLATTYDGVPPNYFSGRHSYRIGILGSEHGWGMPYVGDVIDCGELRDHGMPIYRPELPDGVEVHEHDKSPFGFVTMRAEQY